MRTSMGERQHCQKPVVRSPKYPTAWTKTRTLRRSPPRRVITLCESLLNPALENPNPVALSMPKRCSNGNHRPGAYLAPGVPIPKFAHSVGALSCELRNQNGHWQIYNSSAVFGFEVPM